MATNKPVFYRSLAEIQRRIPDAPQWNGDSFITGCNRGVASGAIGINTGDYDPKATDFARNAPRWATPASYIGQYDQAVADMEDRMVGLTTTDDQINVVATGVGFDTAASDTAADADYGTLPVTNYTGKTIPSGGWAWGFEAAGGDPTPPTSDGGGPYTFNVLDEKPNYTTVTLTGTSVAGTDPAPTYYWAIISGVVDDGLNTWTGRDTLNATFKSRGVSYTTGHVITMALIVTPNDGPAVASQLVTLTYVGF